MGGAIESAAVEVPVLHGACKLLGARVPGGGRGTRMVRRDRAGQGL